MLAVGTASAPTLPETAPERAAASHGSAGWMHAASAESAGSEFIHPSIIAEGRRRKLRARGKDVEEHELKEQAKLVPLQSLREMGAC